MYLILGIITGGILSIVFRKQIQTSAKAFVDNYMK